MWKLKKFKLRGYTFFFSQKNNKAFDHFGEKKLDLNLQVLSPFFELYLLYFF